MIEFLFCPYHGLFRPDNIVLLYQSGYAILVSAQIYLNRYAGWIL